MLQRDTEKCPASPAVPALYRVLRGDVERIPISCSYLIDGASYFLVDYELCKVCIWKGDYCNFDDAAIASSLALTISQKELRKESSPSYQSYLVVPWLDRFRFFKLVQSQVDSNSSKLVFNAPVQLSNSNTWLFELNLQANDGKLFRYSLRLVGGKKNERDVKLNEISPKALRPDGVFVLEIHSIEFESFIYIGSEVSELNIISAVFQYMALEKARRINLGISEPHIHVIYAGQEPALFSRHFNEKCVKYSRSLNSQPVHVNQNQSSNMNIFSKSFPRLVVNNDTTLSFHLLRIWKMSNVRPYWFAEISKPFDSPFTSKDIYAVYFETSSSTNFYLWLGADSSLIFQSSANFLLKKFIQNEPTLSDNIPYNVVHQGEEPALFLRAFFLLNREIGTGFVVISGTQFESVRAIELCESAEVKNQGAVSAIEADVNVLTDLGPHPSKSYLVLFGCNHEKKSFETCLFWHRTDESVDVNSLGNVLCTEAARLFSDECWTQVGIDICNLKQATIQHAYANGSSSRMFLRSLEHIRRNIQDEDSALLSHASHSPFNFSISAQSSPIQKHSLCSRAPRLFSLTLSQAETCTEVSEITEVGPNQTFSQRHLLHSGCYLLDPGKKSIFLWEGHSWNLRYRDSALSLAVVYAAMVNVESTNIVVIHSGCEPIEFLDCFRGWKRSRQVLEPIESPSGSSDTQIFGWGSEGYPDEILGEYEGMEGPLYIDPFCLFSVPLDLVQGVQDTQSGGSSYASSRSNSISSATSNLPENFLFDSLRCTYVDSVDENLVLRTSNHPYTMPIRSQNSKIDLTVQPCSPNLNEFYMKVEENKTDYFSCLNENDGLHEPLVNPTLEKCSEVPCSPYIPALPRSVPNSPRLGNLCRESCYESVTQPKRCIQVISVRNFCFILNLFFVLFCIGWVSTEFVFHSLKNDIVNEDEILDIEKNDSSALPQANVALEIIHQGNSSMELDAICQGNSPIELGTIHQVNITMISESKNKHNFRHETATLVGQQNRSIKLFQNQIDKKPNAISKLRGSYWAEWEPTWAFDYLAGLTKPALNNSASVLMPSQICKFYEKIEILLSKSKKTNEFVVPEKSVSKSTHFTKNWYLSDEQSDKDRAIAEEQAWLQIKEFEILHRTKTPDGYRHRKRLSAI